jgi:hypothetical protein
MLFVIYLAWMSPTYCNSRQNVFDAYVKNGRFPSYSFYTFGCLNVNEKVYHVILNLFTTNDHQKVYQH